MKKSVLLWIGRKNKKHIPMLILVTVLFAVVAYLGVQATLQTKVILEIVQNNMTAGAEGTTLQRMFSGEFLKATIVLAVLICSTFLLRFLANNFQEKLLIQLEIDSKKYFFGRLLHGEFSAVHAYHSADLVNRLSGDVKTVNNGFASLLPSVVQMATRLISAAVVLFLLDPWMTLVVLVLGIIVAAATAGFRKKLKALHKDDSRANGRVNGFIQETLEKLLIVEAMDVAPEMERRAEDLFVERKKIQTKQKNYRLWGRTGLNMAMNLIYYGVMIYCALQLMAGTITFGSLSAMTRLVGEVEGPLANASGMISQYIQMLGSAERLMELEEIDEVPDDAQDAETLYTRMTKLVGCDVTFTYPDDTEETFREKTFEIQKGKFTAIVGDSGCGKSTLLKLLLGIYPIDSGSLAIDFGDTQEALSRKTRRLFTYVPQGNLLISGTLRENLLLAKPEATEEELARAVEISCLSDFVKTLEHGLDTAIGENASGISEGQAQRVSIARAVLRDAPIILLDEATSALDEKTEREVLVNIRQIPDKTVIAVAHRPAAKEMADYVITF